MALTRRRDVGWFLLLQLPIYLTYLLWDCFQAADTVCLKYAGIVLCTCFAVHAAALGGDRLVAWAMGFTLAADAFLLVLDCWYFIGVALFCVVQSLYLLRLLRANGHKGRWAVRAGAVLAGLALLRALDLLNSLTALAGVYFINFACTTLQSFFVSTARFRVFSVGLSLFLCCDVCVAAVHCPVLFPAVLTDFVPIGMWLFYLPGQVFIVLSALPRSAFMR